MKGEWWKIRLQSRLDIHTEVKKMERYLQMQNVRQAEWQVPKDVHGLIPGAWEAITLHGYRDSGSAIRIRAWQDSILDQLGRSDLQTQILTWGNPSSFSGRQLDSWGGRDLPPLHTRARYLHLHDLPLPSNDHNVLLRWDIPDPLNCNCDFITAWHSLVSPSPTLCIDLSL